MAIAKERGQKRFLIMGKKGQTKGLSTEPKLCFITAVGNHVCGCDEETPASRINNKWICAKCQKPLIQ